MAKDITEIINAAAVVRDETGEAANTAARVGGSIADVAQYIKEEIITPLLTAQSKAVSAERIAEYAKKIAEEAVNKNTKQDELLAVSVATDAAHEKEISSLKNKDAELAAKDAEIMGTIDSINRALNTNDQNQLEKINANIADIAALKAKDTALEAKDAELVAKNERQDNHISYCEKNIYKLNEDAGSLAFHGSYAGNATISTDRKTAAEDGHTYQVVKKGNDFYLKDISPGGGTVMLYEEWNALGGVASSESYARTDIMFCLPAAYSDDKMTHYYYKVVSESGFELRDSAATYLLRRLYDAQAKEVKSLKADADAGVARNLSLTDNKTLRLLNGQGGKIGAAATLQDKSNLYEGSAGTTTVPLVMAKALGGTVEATLGAATSARAGVMSAADKTKVDNYPEQFVLDLGIVESQAYGEREAAKSEVAGNRNISFIRFQVRGVKELKTILIMQWPNGIHETAQIMCVDKQQWRRNVTGATGVAGAPTNAYNWERTAPHSIVYDEQRRMIQLKDYQTEPVSQGVELPLVTSSKPGLMSSADKTKLDSVDIAAIQAKNLEQDNRIANAEAVNIKQNERLLNYVYPKLYQLNEGAGALPFDGMYIGSASVLSGRKTAAEEGYTYKVVFALGKFLLQEISPGDVTVGLYEEWDKIISGRGSSEDYTRRDCLYYIYVSGEGSTYYHIDSNGVASEKSATYLLRLLANKNDAAIATLQGNDSAQDARLDALENPPAPDYVEMIVEAPVAKHYALFYDARCIGWLEIDGEEETVPEVTGNKSVKYWAALSPGRHVVRFRPKEGNMSDGTPWKKRQGMLAWCKGNCVTEVTLPEGWTEINTKMFEQADSLRRVNLPSTITTVGFGAFGECAALEEIVLPESVETIEHIIAHDCPALKRIVLGGRDVEIKGTLAQTCTELDCVEFRAGGTAAFKTSNNAFVNLPKLGRFIIGGNLPTFECSQPFTSSGDVGKSVSADTRWLFTSDGETPSGNKWQTSLMSQCGFTVKGRRSYELV